MKRHGPKFRVDDSAAGFFFVSVAPSGKVHFRDVTVPALKTGASRISSRSYSCYRGRGQDFCLHLKGYIWRCDKERFTSLTSSETYLCILSLSSAAGAAPQSGRKRRQRQHPS